MSSASGEPSSSSNQVDATEKVEVMKKADDLLAQGKRNMVCGEVPKAVNLFEDAVKLLVKHCGEMSRDCADAYFHCGSALLEMGRMETNVLGTALDGVEVEEEKDEAESEQFEKAPADDDEQRDELREKVYDAMSEDCREELKSEKKDEPTKDENNSKTEGKMETAESKEEVQAKKDENGDQTKDENKMETTESKQEVQATKDENKMETTESKQEVQASKDEKNSETAESEKKSETAESKQEGQAAKDENSDQTEVEKTAKEDKRVSKEDLGNECKNKDKDESKNNQMDTNEDSNKSKKVAENEEKTKDHKDTSENCIESTKESKDKQVDTKEVSKQSIDSSESKDTENIESSKEQKDSTEQNSNKSALTDVTNKSKDENELKKEGVVTTEDDKTSEIVKDVEMESEAKENVETEDNADDATAEAEDGDTENGEDDENEEEAEEADEEKDGDGVDNFQLAWEYLDVAKVIYIKKEEKDDQLKAAECLLKLGEISMETEQHANAATDLESALNIQKKYLSEDDRMIAETHYQLGLAFGLGKEFPKAIEQYKQAIGVIEAKIVSLTKLIEKKEVDAENKENRETDELMKFKEEIKELKELIPEMQNKIEDTRVEQTDLDKMKEVAREMLGLSGTAKGFSSPTKKDSKADASGASSANVDENGEKKASDIAHLVRKKRKVEDEPSSTVKDVKKVKHEENGEGDMKKDSASGASSVITNGHISPKKLTEAGTVAEPMTT